MKTKPKHENVFWSKTFNENSNKNPSISTHTLIEFMINGPEHKTNQTNALGLVFFFFSIICERLILA